MIIQGSYNICSAWFLDIVAVTVITVKPANPVVLAFDCVTLTCAKVTITPNEDIKYSWHCVSGDIQKPQKEKCSKTHNS